MMVRVVLVGCGRIAQRHAGILAGPLRSQARVAAVCDIQADRAQALGRHCGVPWFTDFHVMMETVPDIDVISVLTPSGLHAAHVLEVVPYRKHLIIEKPLALTLPDADAMIAACDRAGIRLFVVLQNRYNRPVRKLQAAIEAGRFGRFVMGSVRVRWCRTQEYYEQDPWRGTWELDGGIFANQAIHHIDLLTWLMGDVESVFAKVNNQLLDISVPDTGVAVLKFAHGALGLIEATVATRPTGLEASLSIMGEHGVVEIGGFAVNEMKVWKFRDHGPADEDVFATCRENPPDAYGFGHTAFLQEVIWALNSGRDSVVDGREGRKSLEVVHALYRSAEKGVEVALRDQPQSTWLGAGVARSAHGQ